MLVSSPESIQNRPEALRAFLRATARGYNFAAENPEAAVELLLETAPAGSFPDPGLVRDSQRFVSQHYPADGEAWGHQRPAMWRGYQGLLLDANVFAEANDAVREAVEAGTLYTNELFPEWPGEDGCARSDRNVLPTADFRETSVAPHPPRAIPKPYGSTRRRLRPPRRRRLPLRPSAVAGAAALEPSSSSTRRVKNASNSPCWVGCSSRTRV